MIQNVLQHIGGIENYGLASLCVFFVVFLGVLIWAFRLKKADLDAAAALPLENDAPRGQSETRYD